MSRIGLDIPQNDPNCLNARLDGDADVDQDDYAVSDACMSGANIPPDPYRSG